MRMRGQIAYVKEKEEEEEQVRNGEENKMVAAVQKKYTSVVGGGFPPSPMKVVVVGYALTSKKTKSFLQPKLEGLARHKGILFVAIDQSRPLSDQGPFDVVLHKLSGKEWRCVIEDYRQTHPEVTVLDPPHAIQQVHNRQSMLQDVTDLNLSDAYGKFLQCISGLLLVDDYVHTSPLESGAVRTQLESFCLSLDQQMWLRKLYLSYFCGIHLKVSMFICCAGKVGVPKQLVFEKDPSSIPDAVNQAGLRLPIVAKPLVAKSHELSLAYDEYSLQKLEPPLVLQEFINHGGVLFKVYIVGEAIKVVRRFSLPDVNNCDLSKNAGVYRFPRVSCAAASADEADLDPCVAELPPRPLLERLARELRRRLLQFFDRVFGCST